MLCCVFFLIWISACLLCAFFFSKVHCIALHQGLTRGSCCWMFLRILSLSLLLSLFISFCLFGYFLLTVHQDDMWVLAMQSVFEESLPRPSVDTVRGEMFPSAWILQRSQRQGREIVTVIYLLQVTFLSSPFIFASYWYFHLLFKTSLA